MDSLTLAALGAAVGMAAMGRRTALWKAAVWGAVAGTLPDLDSFIDHGDPVSNMVLHRGHSHSLFWLTLFALPFGAAVARWHGQWAHWRRWCLAIWLALVTHPLLDLLTVYGTQLALPFTDFPFAVGSVFIIDPLVTVPLLAGIAVALTRQALRPNAIGLALAGTYLAAGIAAQQHVERVAQDSLAARGIAAERVLVSPTAFNGLLWRVVAIEGERYHEGFYSLLDAMPSLRFDAFERGLALGAPFTDTRAARQVSAFSHGFYKFERVGTEVRIADLRMGQEPTYTFTFAIGSVAAEGGATAALEPPAARTGRPDIGRALAWLWRRMLGQPLAPPRTA
jgi:inner membrane protein